ncbi:MAG: SDR family NAD(P)-dependent oxidoreductase [Thermoplasmata archaeon]
MNIQGKTVLVTGSSSGIGRETVKKFAEEGSRVIITYNSGKKRAEETAEYCRNYTDTKVIKLDVTDISSIENVVQKVEKELDRLDILVNNAGVLEKGKLIKETYQDIKKQIDVNLTGLINVTRTFLPMISKNDRGLIINIASGLGKSGIGGYGVYSGTKFGVRGFTQALVDELPKGIMTYVVNPSMTATNMTNYSGRDPKRVADAIVNTAKEQYKKKIWRRYRRHRSYMKKERVLF